MKRVQALKNKETGKIDFPQLELSDSWDATGKKWNIWNGDTFIKALPKSEYSKVTCLLIEESELKERIKKEISIVNAVYDSKFEYDGASNEVKMAEASLLKSFSKTLSDLLNPLTESE